MTKNIASVSILVLASFLASSAIAADINGGSLKDGPSITSGSGTVNWTGLYIGGQVGLGHANHELTINEHYFVPDEIPAGSIATLDAPAGSFRSDELFGLDGIGATGVLGGGRIGFDVARGRFLFGVFGEYNFSNIETEIRALDGYDDNGNPTHAKLGIEKDGEWSIGGRLGYLVAPRTLTYVLAAYTQTEYKITGLPSDFEVPEGVSFKSNIKMDGVTLGAGVEYAMGGGFFAGLEGLYTMYGKETVYDDRSEGYGNTADIETNELKVMGTLKYKIGAGLPSLSD